MEHLQSAIEAYTNAYYAGLLHLDRYAVMQYATGWLGEWIEAHR